MRYSDYYDNCKRINDEILANWPKNFQSNSPKIVFECDESIKLPSWVGWNQQTLSRMKKIEGVWYII